MQNLMKDLTKLFQKDERIYAEGNLLKNKLTELALKLDQTLIELLLANNDSRKHFFIEETLKKDKVLIFDKDKFIAFVNNKEFLPDSFTSFKNKIGLMTNGDYLKDKDDAVLAWAYKDCVLEGGQDNEDQERDEIFYNETLSPDEIDRLFDPKVMTNFKKCDSKGENKVTQFKGDDNLIIKGNNLLVMHSLKNRYRGKIKLIYIDPPYNTGTDSFHYNDNFNHSTWLTFMKNRLEVARELLSDEGAIFVQIDDNEMVYLKVMMDEIFGKNNQDVTLYIQVRYEAKTLSEKMDYQKLIEQVFVYRKDSFKPIKESEEYDINNFEWKVVEKVKPEKIILGSREVEVFKSGQFEIRKVEANIKALKETWASGTVLKGNASGKFFNDFLSNRIKSDGLGALYKVYGIGEDGLGYRFFTGPKKAGATKGKFYSGVPLVRVEQLKEGNALKYKIIPNLYDFAGAFGNCRHEGGVELRSGKKPEILLKTIIQMSTAEGDTVLDFFAGTGTTCAVAHKMGRRYIGVEQLDYGKNSALVRLKNVIKGDQTGISEVVGWKGGGSFVYLELKEWNEKYMTEIKEATTTRKLLSIYKKMKREAFFRYEVDLSKFEEAEFETLSLREQKQVLFECLDKNHLYVNLSEVDDATYKVSTEEKKLNKEFYKTAV